jgi:hypothetical protein
MTTAYVIGAAIGVAGTAAEGGRHYPNNLNGEWKQGGVFHCGRCGGCHEPHYVNGHGQCHYCGGPAR